MDFYPQLQESSFNQFFAPSNMYQMTSSYSIEEWMAYQYQEMVQNYISQFWFWGSQDCIYDFTKETAVKDSQYSSSLKKKSKKSLMLKKANLEENADEIMRTLLMIKSESTVLVSGKRKAESKEGPLSDTRSSFIGVSRNGLNWQALIAINKRKTYIGSYESEKDAALAFDFYSILLHSLTAKTNFSYSKEDIINMITNYKQNGNIFKPEQLNMIYSN